MYFVGFEKGSRIIHWVIVITPRVFDKIVCHFSVHVNTLTIQRRMKNVIEYSAFIVLCCWRLRSEYIFQQAV